MASPSHYPQCTSPVNTLPCLLPGAGKRVAGGPVHTANQQPASHRFTSQHHASNCLGPSVAAPPPAQQRTLKACGGPRWGPSTDGRTSAVQRNSKRLKKKQTNKKTRTELWWPFGATPPSKYVQWSGFFVCRRGPLPPAVIVHLSDSVRDSQWPSQHRRMELNDRHTLPFKMLFWRKFEQRFKYVVDVYFMLWPVKICSTNSNSSLRLCQDPRMEAKSMNFFCRLWSSMSRRLWTLPESFFRTVWKKK